MEEPRPPVGLDTSKAHVARVYDYWLGGKDNFEADRAYGDALEARVPSIRLTCRMNRQFLGRAVSFLTADAGIRQFLDIGTGLPTADNTHQVAQRIAPAARVVYTDNDPLVLVHARALLTSSPEGRTAYIDADVRDPGAILEAKELTETLDLTEPVAVMLIAVLHLVTDDAVAYPAISTIFDAMPSGSYLVISHATGDFWPQEQVDAANATNQAHNVDFRFRTRSEVARFLTGLDLVDPGIVPVAEWRAGPDSVVPPSAESNIWAAVAKKP
ncbi:SAM-dependent methyltransferase [Actinoplanes sp. KI2]|uniref:SAM-dependent methyltransferase n=1 Tax=Actinoplanes sp. KI2 TaxID=2983315 RepID=UPI0021D5A10C|nr:SAM-dependent methyltransferase [Actinoplanes sp. KI2]MCU7730412.1 SAM-dependent methyltransferase [Actinoplanes sp. KI2]